VLYYSVKINKNPLLQLNSKDRLMAKKIKITFFVILIVPISFLGIEAILRGAYELRDIFRAAILSDFYKNKEEIIYDGKESFFERCILV
jgi:hypothetical protein